MPFFDFSREKRARLGRRCRPLAFAAGFALTLIGSGVPAFAQDISLLRDTETEEMLKSYEAPLAKAAGLNPDATRVWLVGDNDVNAFASFGDGGENIFILSGIILTLKTPNELIGVMAHETGHIKAGHLIRGEVGMQKAAIPMLLSMVIGIAAMIAGAGEAGMVIMGAGQAMAQAQFAQFTRIQESTADQIAMQLLLATHQSPQGIYNTFARFASEEAQGAYKIDPYAVDHPVGQQRLDDIQAKLDSSPYKDVKDSPAVTHTFEMVQAKLAGFVLPVSEALKRYPVSDTSEVARYARAMIYLRQPQLAKAQSEVSSLIQDEPNNPYFYEVQGQIYLSMAKPLDAIPAYQKAVNLKPQAPQLRLGLAVAQISTDRPELSQAALANLKVASMMENDDVFTWYETAQAYSNLKNTPMANLSTAESYYAAGAMKQAALFAARAKRDLTQGTADWERAGDIMGAAASQSQQR
ncbi:MAG TPA: M48 family metalloprotease [Rhizomicrobium sp.]|nr:M48 family metalloprotease [Rhizomicrobium sp.]